MAFVKPVLSTISSSFTPKPGYHYAPQSMAATRFGIDRCVSIDHRRRCTSQTPSSSRTARFPCHSIVCPSRYVRPCSVREKINGIAGRNCTRNDPTTNWRRLSSAAANARIHSGISNIRKVGVGEWDTFWPR